MSSSTYGLPLVCGYAFYSMYLGRQMLQWAPIYTSIVPKVTMRILIYRIYLLVY